MIKIAICDDEIHQLNLTCDIVHNIVNSNNLDVDILKFSSSFELLDIMHNKNDLFDILFLDIIMDPLNGIDLAKAIREFDANVKIIFTTNSKDYILDGYEVNPSNYFLKPLTQNKIEIELMKCIKDIYSKKNDFIVVKYGHTISRHTICKILFFESNLRQIVIHNIDGSTIQFYDKLNDIEFALKSKSFIRCHKSFLVNMNHIYSIDGTTITTINGYSIPISRSYLKSTKDAFLEYFSYRL